MTVGAYSRIRCRQRSRHHPLQRQRRSLLGAAPRIRSALNAALTLGIAARVTRLVVASPAARWGASWLAALRRTRNARLHVLLLLRVAAPSPWCRLQALTTSRKTICRMKALGCVQVGLCSQTVPYANLVAVSTHKIAANANKAVTSVTKHRVRLLCGKPFFLSTHVREARSLSELPHQTQPILSFWSA